MKRERGRAQPSAGEHGLTQASAGERRRAQANTREKIYSIVRRIPRGRVATYGQVAGMAGLRGHARQVGYALHGLPEGSDLPWHRVINAEGKISLRRDSGPDRFQRALLEAEGVQFDENGVIPLNRYRWRARR